MLRMDRLGVPDSEALALDEAVAQICGPGASFSSSQRTAMATMARRIWMDGLASSTADGIAEAVARLTLDAHRVRPEWIASVSDRGVTPIELVELLGVVSSTVAVDTFCFALGVAPWPLTEPPGNGEPHGEVDPAATNNGGWLPTVGRAWPTNALSALPSDERAMHRLHAALYLAMDQMGDMDAHRGLHRTQMELVAARTSLLNECFF